MLQLQRYLSIIRGICVKDTRGFIRFVKKKEEKKTLIAKLHQVKQKRLEMKETEIHSREIETREKNSQIKILEILKFEI